MIAAVHTFNGAGLQFRAEIFIVTASLLDLSDARLLPARRGGLSLPPRWHGPDHAQRCRKYWELGQCVGAGACPLDRGTINNLNFLLDIRHEIEHRSTNRIDDALSAKLQACCLNFNDAIKALFARSSRLSVVSRSPCNS